MVISQGLERCCGSFDGPVLAAGRIPVKFRCIMISDSSSAPESLRYVMLGEDSQTTEEKLAKYMGRVAWSYLAPHYLKGSLYFVDPVLKLEDVGAAMSRDRADLVGKWLKAGDLVKVEALHAAQWEAAAGEFEALVVSPFVLCRPLG